LFIRQSVTSEVREILLNYCPFAAVLATPPYPLGGKLLPVGQVLHPLDFRLSKQLLLSA